MCRIQHRIRHPSSRHPCVGTIGRRKMRRVYLIARNVAAGVDNNIILCAVIVFSRRVCRTCFVNKLEPSKNVTDIHQRVFVVILIWKSFPEIDWLVFTILRAEI